MKKLLHLQALPLLSGVQNFSLHLLDGLDPQEFILAIASAPGGALPEACKDRGIRHIPLRFLKREIGLWDIPALWQLIVLIRKERYDIVHTNTSKAGFLGRLAARLCRVPNIIHTAHGVPFQPGQKKPIYRFYMWLEKLGNRLCDTVVYVNDSDRLRCIKLGLVHESKARTIYNAIPQSLQQKLNGIAAERVLTAKDKLVIGSTLRFSEQKNTIELTTALIKACHRADNLCFCILGEGENLELCRSMVKSHSLQNRILMPGWCSDIIPSLRDWDAFILYSRWEAMPFSIIEAMHSGLAVIGSDITAIRELVNPDTGYIAPLRQPDKLVDLLVILAGNYPDLYVKGQAALKFIQNKTSYPRMVESYQQIYKEQRS